MSDEGGEQRQDAERPASQDAERPATHHAERPATKDAEWFAAGSAAPSSAAPRLQIEPGARGAFWQIGFPALVVLAALAVPFVAWFGKESLLESRGGKVEAPILDPRAPGYEAVVEPTPTMLVVHLADNDTLVGLTFLAQAGVDGGSVLFVPVNTSIEVDDLGLPDPSTVTTSVTGATTTAVTTDSTGSAESTVGGPGIDGTATTIDPTGSTSGPTATGALPLKDVYQLGGTPAVVEGVEKLLGVGIGGRTIEIDGEVVDDPDASSVIEVTNARWRELVTPLAPLAVDNSSVVTVTDQPSGEVVGQFPEGTIELPAEGIGPFLEARNEGESELNRLGRHQAFWLAWLEDVSQSSDPAVVPGEVDSGLGGFVRGLASSNVAFFNLPVDTVSIPGSPDDLFLPDEEAVADLIVSLVPFPVGSEVSPRSRIRVLDGTGTEGLALEAAELLVRAGAEIELTGNAASFDHVSNDVIYYDESMADTARLFADVLGGAAIARADEPGEIVELTIVLGSDFDPDAEPVAVTTTFPATVPSDAVTVPTGGEGG